MKEPIKIILLDDNARIRDSLALLFSTQEGFEWQGAYRYAAEVMDIMDIYNPDVVLMDIDIPALTALKQYEPLRKGIRNR